MRTVQITLEEDLVQAVDRAADRLDQSRSAFTRAALRTALARLAVQAREQQHRAGYLQQPVTPDEFDALRREGEAMGFHHVASGPLVRSSYHADLQAHAAGVTELA